MMKQQNPGGASPPGEVGSDWDSTIGSASKRLIDAGLDRNSAADRLRAAMREWIAAREKCFANPSAWQLCDEQHRPSIQHWQAELDLRTQTHQQAYVEWIDVVRGEETERAHEVAESNAKLAAGQLKAAERANELAATSAPPSRWNQ
jgi:hypothetical protein